MATLTVADGVRYLLVTCEPNGEQTVVRTDWDAETTDAEAALLMAQGAVDDLRRVAEADRVRRARLLLVTPLPAPAIAKNGK